MCRGRKSKKWSSLCGITSSYAWPTRVKTRPPNLMRGVCWFQQYNSWSSTVYEGREAVWRSAQHTRTLSCTIPDIYPSQPFPCTVLCTASWHSNSWTHLAALHVQVCMCMVPVIKNLLNMQYTNMCIMFVSSNVPLSFNICFTSNGVKR